MLSFTAMWSFDSVTSTMEVARELAPRFEVGDVGLVVARHQTAGRGRQGRLWLSAEGAFLGTYILSLPSRPLELRGFSLVVGLVINQVLARRGMETFLKWPNDVLSPDGRKIAGVLIEVIPSKRGLLVLCGIGCNLEHTPEGVSGAVSVSELGGSFSRYEFIQEINPVLVEYTDRFLEKGFAAFREEWLAQAYIPSGAVLVRSSDGIISAAWRGITSIGELVVIDGEGRERIVSSGDMTEESFAPGG